MIEGKNEIPLTEILDKSLTEEEIFNEPDRFRIPIEPLVSNDDILSESSRRLSDFDEASEIAFVERHSAYLMRQARGEVDYNLKPDTVFDTPSFLTSSNMSYGGSSSSTSPAFSSHFEFTQDMFFKGEGMYPGFYPLQRDTHELTAKEMQSHAKELRSAQLKELASWVKHSGALPKLKSEFKGKIITSRWILTFKYKSGVLIVKARLVLRGFQEQL